MAHTKPKWRRVLTGRFLRWWIVACAVRLVPSLGRRLGFFPEHIGVIEGSDRVLADEVGPVPLDLAPAEQDFLGRCAPHDARSPGAKPPDGVVTGRAYGAL